MKKVLLLVLCLIAFVALSTNAETIEKDKGYISVNESITRDISPNQAEISIGIVTSNKSLKQASEDNKLIANKVYSSLKPLLGMSDYIKTSNYSAQPVYIYTKDNQRVLDKYSVSNTVTVKTKNIELVSKLIDTAISQGATNIDSLQFTATDYDSECNAALAEITKKAQKKANTVANSVNSQITGIKSINVSCNPDNGPRPYYAMMAKSSLDGASATPIESGKIKIYANIDASFYVK